MTKPVPIFLRCPVSVAERILAAIKRENAARSKAGQDAVLLYKGEPCLPPYFARAGEREVELFERNPGVAAAVTGGTALWRSCRRDRDASAREATLNVNFDVPDSLAARAIKTIRATNAALRGVGEQPVCLRGDRPSLPPFFLRAGLLELDRDELASPPAASGPHEGQRLRAARVAAGLGQGDLGVSRGMVQRAEGSASLDNWPTLRTWLVTR